jgi:hypothetical protein
MSDKTYAQFLSCHVKKAFIQHKALLRAAEYGQRSYKCDYCDYWHLTSKVKKEK